MSKFTRIQHHILGAGLRFFGLHIPILSSLKQDAKTGPLLLTWSGERHSK